MDIYAIVTEKIINLLEQGVVPGRRPWAVTGLPRNLVSKKPYRGINHFLLSASRYISPFWLTMRRANELGGHVRKGEESTLIVYWKVEDLGENREDLDNEETDRKARRRFLLRYYSVWNPEQRELPRAVLNKLPRIETHEHDLIDSRRTDRCRNAESARNQARQFKGLLREPHRPHDHAAACAVHVGRGVQRHNPARADSRNRPSEAA